MPERRLWLYGSVAASPGTSGLYRTARTEPMGERLRLLFNGDPVLTHVRGNKQDPAGAISCPSFPVFSLSILLRTKSVAWHVKIGVQKTSLARYWETSEMQVLQEKGLEVLITCTPTEGLHIST